MTEGITNGGFETGDTTGWTLTDGAIITTNPHSGTYLAEIYPSGARTLEQTLSEPIQVNDITSFSLWYRDSESCWCKILYTEGDSGNIPIPDSLGVWQELDLMPYLTAGKTVTGIKILNGYVRTLYIDDVSLNYVINGALVNSGGTLYIDIIDWKEEQRWLVAIRNVPLSTSGAHIDTGTTVMEPKIITIKIRLSESEKTTLQAIIDANEIATLTTIDGIWSYNVWVASRNPKYVYREFDGNTKPWETTLKLIVKSGGKV